MPAPVNAHLFYSVNGVVTDPHLFQFDSFGEAEGALMGQALAGVTDLVIGRKLWQEWKDYWATADDPFANLLYQEGRNSVQVYDQVDDGFSFGAEFAVGLKIGASFSSSSTTSTINSAIFLGAPGADGTRGYVNDAVCSLD